MNLWSGAMRTYLIKHPIHLKFWRHARNENKSKLCEGIRFCERCCWHSAQIKAAVQCIRNELKIIMTNIIMVSHLDNLKFQQIILLNNRVFAWRITQVRMCCMINWECNVLCSAFSTYSLSLPRETEKLKPLLTLTERCDSGNFPNNNIWNSTMTPTHLRPTFHANAINSAAAGGDGFV